MYAKNSDLKQSVTSPHVGPEKPGIHVQVSTPTWTVHNPKFSQEFAVHVGGCVVAETVDATVVVGIVSGEYPTDAFSAVVSLVAIVI